MAIEAISGVVSKGIAASGDNLRSVGSVSSVSSYTGTSDAVQSNAAFKGDIQNALNDQVNELIRSQKRMQKSGANDAAVTGVSSEPAAPVNSIKEALNQVRSVYDFGVKATLLGSVANQSVSAVTTLAKSQ